MRKLYAFLTGIFFILVGLRTTAQTIPAIDVANFSITVNADNNDVAFTNTSILSSLPGTRRAHWSFGDGTGQWTLPLANTAHRYNSAGSYTVCLKIFRYVSNTNDSVLSAQVCKTIEIPVRCKADFERLPITTSNSPLTVAFKALPSHNGNKKPARICWTFGDGRDTCIQYPENYTGLYTVAHRYNQPGNYEVCVKILYYGGCEVRKCKAITIERPDECRADFEKLPLTTSNSLLHAVFKALPAHNNNKKPARICWSFGDGRDTCISYTNSHTGPYTVAHRYNQQGNYEVCVKILYFGGCEARKCKPVQIGPRPDSCGADFERVPVIDVNDPLKTIFKALPSHNNNKKPKTICWKFGDGRDTCINYPENYTGTYTVRHRYNHSGNYEVCVKILYYGGCEARKCKDIRIGNPATCTAGIEVVPIPIIGHPNTVVLKAVPWNSQNRKPKTICWTFGDDRDTCINYPENYTGIYGVVHRYNNSGNYEVCVKILYYGGCEARKCKNIQVGPLATCTADFERAPLHDNNPLTIALKALPSNSQNRKPARICWSFGDGRDTCINYPENYTGLYLVGHRYAQPGNYEVCVKILYYGGCEARKCRSVEIPPPPVECRVRLFEITPSITSLVRGFYANASSNPERRIERICWYFGDGDDTCIMITPTTPDPIPQPTIRHTYPGPGVYRACVKVRFVGGCEAHDCVEVVIRPLGDICGGFMTDSLAGPRTYTFRGHSINRPNDEVIGYRWTFGDGTTATGREVTHTYQQAGDFEVCLYIKTRLGCETRICNTVRVPGNNEPQLHLTPNPVINAVTVSFRSTHTETVNIKIVNPNGVPVRSFTRSVTVGPNTWTHDLSSLPTGVYSYNVQSPNQQASVIFLKN
jgi:PKD repeat protein